MVMIFEDAVEWPPGMIMLCGGTNGKTRRRSGSGSTPASGRRTLRADGEDVCTGDGIGRPWCRKTMRP